MHSTDTLNAALIGRYEIERQIGAGGMATVYLARDLKNRRRVAIKVLSPELGAILGAERFLAEIEVTANLHHPHLLPLFDSGEAGGLLYYVMPYIEGETLRARLERERQLTIDDAVHITRAIASAVDYAHRHGVIHRDLKPENILLHEGEPLVMDFGIALAVSKAGGERITQTGVSLGTPQYMSPEQAMGDRQIDGRSDIYSLAAVLYEMLAGDPPHTGSTAQAIVARIITDRPPSLRSARDTVPESIDAAVQRGLAKLPADRPSTAMEFAESVTAARTVAGSAMHAAIVAASPITGMPELPASHRRGTRAYREAAAWMITVAAVGIAAAAMSARRSPTVIPGGLFRIDLPDSVKVFTGGGLGLAISHDGSRIAFVGERAGRRMLYLRHVDDPIAQPVLGSDSALFPAFSPSGDWLLYNSGASLRKVPSGGGTPQKVADSVLGTASWGDDNRIVVTRAARRIYSISSDGASQRLVGAADTAHKILQYLWPDVLPGSKHALITYWRGLHILDSARVGVISLADGALTDLGLAGVNPHYVSDGYVVFAGVGGLVMAAPFSLTKRRVTGPPTLLLSGVWMGGSGAADAAVANNKTLVYHAGNQDPVSLLVRVDSVGREKQLPLPERVYYSPRISPDGRHVALDIYASPNDVLSDLWMLDVETNGLRPLTSDSKTRSRFYIGAGNYSSRTNAEWTRDGARVVYHGDSGLVVSRAWDGSGEATVLNHHPDLTWAEIALGPPHGYAVMRNWGAQTGADLRIASMDSLETTRPFLASRAQEYNPRVSPNGNVVAYTSNETSRAEVYLRPLPGPGAGIQVSLEGGTEPLWSRDGGSVYYRTPAGTVMAASVTQTATPRVLSRRVLFAEKSPYQKVWNNQSYDVFPNGDFLFLRRVEQESGLMVAVDWTRLLTQRQGGTKRPE